MELLLLPSRATSSWPRHQASARRGVSATAARPAASSSNAEVAMDGSTAATPKNREERRAGGGGLGLELSEDMRRGMTWRMLAPPAAAVAAEAVFLGLLDGAAPGDAPAWAGAAGSAALFAVGLLGCHYGFLSSRWDAAEKGSLVGWELAVRHWNVLSMARQYSPVDDEEDGVYDDDDEEEEDDEEWEDDEDEDDVYID